MAPIAIALLERISKFKARQSGVRIAPWYTTSSGMWETTEPGTDEPREWIKPMTMMNYLEEKYPRGEAAMQEGTS